MRFGMSDHIFNIHDVQLIIIFISGVMTIGVMSVGEITVGVMTVGVMTVGVMRRRPFVNVFLMV
jgi:hypothetical protein